MTHSNRDEYTANASVCTNGIDLQRHAALTKQEQDLHLQHLRFETAIAELLQGINGMETGGLHGTRSVA